MEKEWTFDLHPSEEMIEEYCFDRLLEPTQIVLEEHLLVCPVCQQTLQNLDEYILLMKAATSEYAAIPVSGLRRKSFEAAETLRLTLRGDGTADWQLT